MSSDVDKLRQTALTATGPGWRRRRAVRALARAGTPEAARELAEVLAGTADDRVAEVARQELLAFTDQAVWNAVCEVAIASGAPQLASLIRESGRLPSAPQRRALWLVLDGQYDRAAELDFDGHMLRAAHRDADAALRSRIAAAARSAGRIEWIRQDGGALTVAEWESTVSVLENGGRWEELLRVASDTPLPVAARILRTLGARDWRPPASLADSYASLVTLAGRCTTLPSAASLFPKAVTLQESAFQERQVVALNTTRDLLACIDHPTSGGTLWRLPAGEQVGTFPVHEVSPASTALAPDGSMVAIAEYSGGVRLQSTTDWDDSTYMIGGYQSDLHAPHHPVTHLDFTPDGEWLIGTLPSGYAQLWHVLSRQSHWSARAHGDNRTPWFAVSADGRLLATVGSALRVRSTGELRVWSLPSGEPAGSVQLPGGQARPLFTPDGRRVLAVGWWGTRIWDLRSDRTVVEFDRSFGDPFFAVSADGLLMASGNAGRPAEVRRTSDGGLVCELGQLPPDMRKSMALSSDGRVLASADDAPVRVFHVPSGQLAGDLEREEPWRLMELTFTAGDAILGHDRSRVWLSPAEPALLGGVPAGDVTPNEAERLRQRLGHTSDACWAELLNALVWWRRHHDVELADTGSAAAPIDIELDP